MKLKIISDKYNPAFKRKEVYVEIDHDKLGTPDRISIRKNLVEQWKSKENNLYIINCRTETGTNSSICYAEIYDDAIYAQKIVPKHIIKRNFPPPKEEKAPEVKPPEEVPPEEKKPSAEKPPKEEKAPEVKPPEEVPPEEKK